MQEKEVIEILINKLNFKEPTIEKIIKFKNLLLDFNKKRNLISKNSERDIWRMARDNKFDTKPQILALVGRNPYASIDEILELDGIIWLLAGAKYPVNIGFTIRTAEVSGANAVFIDSELNNNDRKNKIK